MNPRGKMIKKFVVFLIIAAGVYFFSPIPAEADSTVDQACTLETTSSDARGIYLNESSTYQVFTPTRDTLDAVEVVLGTSNSGTVKAKIGVIFFENSAGQPVGRIIAEKFVSVTGTQYVKADFTDVPLEDGIYGIGVVNLHDSEAVYWPVTEGNCYPGGYAVVDYETRTDWDFFFSVMTYDSVPAPEEENIDNSGSLPPSPSASITTPGNTAESGSSASSSTTNSTTIQNPPENAKEIDKSEISGQTISTNLSDANQKSAISEKLMSDQELQEQITGILLDIKLQKEKNNGAFGLSGRVGDILTWPVFYGICFLVFLIIVVKIISLIRRKKDIVKPSPEQK
jgi:hypothetical protein